MTFSAVVAEQEADRPEAHVTTKKIYVSGIKDEIDESDLREHFSKFGQVSEAEVIVDKETRKKRGFAFVTFDDYDPVDKVVCEYRIIFRRNFWPPKIPVSSSSAGFGVTLACSVIW